MRRWRRGAPLVVAAALLVSCGDASSSTAGEQLAGVGTAAAPAAPTSSHPPVAASEQPGDVVPAFPATPDPGARHLVYLHGRIVEGQGRRPVSPEHGAYELDAILAALAAGGATVIGEVRGADADVTLAAAHVAGELRRLITAGVPPAHLTVVGASKGSLIAMLVSTALAEPELRYVLLANCNRWVEENHQVDLHGRVLSIYEASDEIGGSCGPIFARSAAVRETREIRLDTGLGHGFLYRPLDAWVAPAVDWAAGETAGAPVGH